MTLFYPCEQVFTAAVGKEEEGSSNSAQKAEIDFPSLAAAGKAAAPTFRPSPASGKSETDGGHAYSDVRHSGLCACHP